MVKIISLFKRNYNTDRLVYNEVVEGAEWVINGEGIATQKFDGTCCMVRDGKLYKRYDARRGRVPPIDFEPTQEPDEVTGHWPGWVPIVCGDRWHVEAALNSYVNELEDGTYELIGPKIQGNPEKVSRHILIPHGRAVLRECPRDYEGIKQYLSIRDIEGIVWHRSDGRMVKIKKRDFGMKRGVIYE